MAKKLFTSYYQYPTRTKKLNERMVLEDSPATRARFVSSIENDDTVENTEWLKKDIDRFINGEVDYLEYEYLDMYTDYDTATGQLVEVKSKEEVLGELEDKYKKEKQEIEELFE